MPYFERVTQIVQRTKFSVLSLLLVGGLFFTSCAREFNAVYKSTDRLYKYEYAKECFANGKYMRCISILEGLIVSMKGTEYAEESLYMMAMAEYCAKDYETAAEYFKKYYTSYPRGLYAEQAKFYVGESLYMSTPEPRLDQSPTVAAIAGFQEFIDLFPESALKPRAQSRLFELQDKLVQKELYSAQLYYDLGTYFGNCNSSGESNYQACIITAQNALKDYPYSSLRENFSLLIMKSKFELAENSTEARKQERYQDAEDECYGFLNEFPDSPDKDTAEKLISKCKKYTKHAEEE